MSEKKYSKKHEWIALNGETATVGISKHATEMLGDIVFVELPEKGKGLNKEEKAAVVESTKAASDVYTPVSGEILETNQPIICLLYTSPRPRDGLLSRMPSSA